MGLRFHEDERFGPMYATDDESLSALGSLLTGDINGVGLAALELLDRVARVRSGDSAHEQWEGNGWSGDVRPDGLHLRDLYSDEWRGDYSLDLAQHVTVEYLSFLAPESADRSRALAEWEAWKGRPHPAHDDIVRAATPITFYRDGLFHHITSLDESFRALGSLLTDDVQGSVMVALDLLEMIERVRLRQTPSERWSGNGWVGQVRATGVHIEDRHSDDWSGDYSLDTARAVVLDYLRYLAPHRDQRAVALSEWEEDRGHRHPAREDI